MKELQSLVSEIAKLDVHSRIAAINAAKIALHEVSPLKGNPVDLVIWVRASEVYANDYNPNSVAPPEMELLRHSISEDGYTQPIVTSPGENGFEVVDGFHRNRVGKECDDVREKILGYLPVVSIRKEKQDKSSRMASTIRHNRARGKHRVDAMSEIVLELKNRNWTNQRVAKELGMDEDEILRLCQITGLAGLFSDEDFSRAWEVEGSSPDDFKFEPIDDNLIGGDEEVRTVNTSDPERIFHTYEKWECFPAGFYASTKDGMTKSECEQYYAAFLSDIPRFEKALEGVITNWKNSCEHYLTNNSMNRIAWLGQASVCYESGIPSCFCSGFNLLSEAQQLAANKAALRFLNLWLEKNNRKQLTLEQAMTDRQSTLY